MPRRQLKTRRRASPTARPPFGRRTDTPGAGPARRRHRRPLRQPRRPRRAGAGRRLRAYTADPRAIADFPRQAGVTTVAMEATGVYGIPLFEHLEARGFECRLIEPGQPHGCGARPKNDVPDCQWMPRLHTYGLLKASFPPARVGARLAGPITASGRRSSAMPRPTSGTCGRPSNR